MENICTYIFKKRKSLFLLFLSFIFFAFRTDAQEVLYGTGTTSTTGSTGPPFSTASGYSYSASEQIYTGTELATSGIISQIGFYKQSGNNDAVDDVSIYLKTTTNTEVSTAVDTAGYILVYKGAFPNSATGWYSVPLSKGFQLNHLSQNLAVLVVKGYQASSSNPPLYRRVLTAKANSSSYYRASGTAWTPTATMTRLTSSSNYRAQLRLVFTPCNTVPEITSVTPSGNQAQVDFSCPSCTGNYTIEYGLSGFVPGSEGTAAGGTVATSAAGSATISGLGQGLTYDVYVRNNCSSTHYSVNSAKYTFTTACGIYSLPYTENFNSVTVPALPPCITTEDLNGGSTWATASYTTNRITVNTAGQAANDWFFTPAFYLDGNKTYRLIYSYRTGSSTTTAQSFKIHTGSAASSASATRLLADRSSVNTNTGTVLDTIYFTTSASGVQHIGFHAYSVSGASSSFLAIDDIDFRLSPITCLPPVAVSATPTSDTSVVLSWSAPVATLTGYYEWEVRTNTSVGNATGRIATGTVTHPNLSVTVNTLSASTNYNVYVRANCSSDGNSAWTSVVTFRTPCGAINAAYTEDFGSTSSSALPTCTSTQGTAWTTATVSSTRVLQYLRSYSAYANGYFFSRGIQLQAGKTYRLKFLYKGSTTSGVLNFKVQAATWADSSHLIPGTLFEGSAISSTSNQEATGTFIPSANGIYYLAFHAYSQTTSASIQNYLYIDDIVFEEFPDCITPVAQPSNLVLTTTQTSVSGSFTVSGADQYLVVRTFGADLPQQPQDGVEYQAGTLALGGYIESAGSATTFTSNYLDISTSYTYWVFAYNHTSCANGPLYLTNNPLTRLVTTLACTSYGTKTFTNTTTNQNRNLNWDAITWTPTGLPGPCDNVIITNQNTTSSGYSLNITVNVPVNINDLELRAEYGTVTTTKGFDLIGHSTYPFIINGNLKISGTSGSPTNSETEFYSQGGNIIIKGNATFGAASDPVHIAFGRNGGNPVFEFRGNLTLDGLTYIRSNGTGEWLFDGTGEQTITNRSTSYTNWPNPGATPAVSFQSVTIGKLNTPTVTIAGNHESFVRGGDLIVHSGATLNIPNGQTFNQYSTNAGAIGLFNGSKIQIGGTANGWSTGNNFPKNYALNYLEPNSTVEYNGNQIQTLVPFAYGNLTVNNAGDIHVPSGVTVDGTLSFIQGKLITDANVLSLSENAVVTGAGQNRYVEGNLSKTIPESATQKVFEVGTALNYTPLTIDFYGNVGYGGSVAVKSTEGAHPEISSSDLSETKYVNAYWDINATNIHSIDSARLTFQYTSGDLSGGANPENLIAARYTASSWTALSTSFLSSNRNRATGILSLNGTYILSEPKGCSVLTDAISAVTLQLASVSSISESCEISDNQWQYFKDASGNIIAAINANGQDLGAVTLDLNLDENHGPYAGSKKCAGRDEYFVGRVVKISSEKNPSQPISFRLFFTNNEYQGFKSAVEAQDFDYKDCYGTTAAYTDLTVSAFYTGAQNAVAVSGITKSTDGPQGSYQFEFSLLPVSANASNGRFDGDGTTFYIHGSGGDGSVLPVELIQFSGKYAAPNVALSWTTASEKNNDRFEILKSTDGISFEKIGEVSGAGNSNIPLEYSFTDKNVEIGRIYFYQLKQLDFDGTQEFSRIITVETGKQTELSVGNFYPNPTQNIATLPINLPGDEKVYLKLYSSDGRLIEDISKQYNQGQHLLDVNIQQLPAGSYVVHIQIGNKSFYNQLSRIH